MSYKDAEKVLWPSTKWGLFFGLPAFVGHVAVVLWCCWMLPGNGFMLASFLAAFAWMAIGHFCFYPRWNRQWKKLLEQP